MVKLGDTVGGIAYRFSTFPDLVAGINNLSNPNYIFVNQGLVVPAFIYQIEAGDTLSSLSRRFGISISAITKANRNRPGFQRRSYLARILFDSPFINLSKYL